MARRHALLVVVAACRSAEPEAPPPRIDVVGASLQLPAGTDASKIKLALANALPPRLDRFTQAIDRHFKLLRLIELEPAGTATRAKLSVTAPGCAKKPEVALLSLDGHSESLASTLAGTNLEIAISKLGTVAVLCPISGLLGSPSQVLRGAPDLLFQEDCASHIAPESPAVKAIAADPKRFAIEPSGHIALDPALAVKDVDESGELAPVDEILSHHGGDPLAVGVVYASLFAARGYPVRLVGGSVTHPDGKKGILGWAETVIDGKPMFVDADRAQLVPLAEATKTFDLQLHRACALYPPGKSQDVAQWTSDVPAAAEPVAAAPTELLEQRKLLEKRCNHGADKAACMERGKLDDQLKAQLDAMAAQHKALEVRCKTNKDAAACTQRDQLAAQGKAIKAQLDAKP